MKKWGVFWLFAVCGAGGWLVPVVCAQVPAKEYREYGADPRGLYGGGRGVRAQDLPPGRLRQQLEALAPAARIRAEENLSHIQFHANDLKSLRSDREGGIYYECDFGLPRESLAPAPPASAEAPAAPPGEGPGLYAAVNVTNPPVYHSRPGSTNILFLDFNGAMISGTQWNISDTVTVWNCKAFDTDGNTNEFSDTEQRIIRQIWERVAEDYSPFNVDVTTEQPATWNNRIGHALITPTTDANGIHCPHYGYGGIAYVNVFGGYRYSYNDPNTYSPAWITIMSGSSYANTAEAAAHELGHNLGLSHDGQGSTNEYYDGHANGEISWGPIMGAAYGMNLSQWSKGEYAAANQPQDDLAIIAAKVSYWPDDNGDTSSAATPLTQNGLVVSATGVVETTDDPDVFSLVTGSGAIGLYARPYVCSNGTWGGDSDLLLKLYDRAGALMATNNPRTNAWAVITAAVPAGVYYLYVYPVGVGNPTNATPSGYTSYGSLGKYAVTGSVTALGTNLFLLEPNGGATYYPSNTVEISWEFGLTNDVKIELYKGGALDSTISAATSNDGSYVWMVPTNQAPGPDYRIRVSDVYNATRWDEGDADFAVASLPIVLLFENFNASTNIPSGWTQQVVSGTTRWKFQTGGRTGGANPTNAYSAPYNACLYDTDKPDDVNRLITPSLNFGDYTNSQLIFWHHMQDWTGDQDLLRVYYRTNAAGAWVQIAEYLTAVPSWTQRVLTLTNLGSSYSLCFEGNAKYGYGVCIDDVQVIASNRSPAAVPVSNQLQVVSAWGAVEPPAGLYYYTNATWLTGVATGTPVAAGSTQYVCVGWIGSGSVPAGGSATNTEAFQLTNDSVLTWLWATNVQFTRDAGPNGSMAGPSSGWYDLGGNVTVTAVPDLYYHFETWMGDVSTGDTSNNPLTVIMSEKRSITGLFDENVTSGHGTPHWWLAQYGYSTNDDAENLPSENSGMSVWQSYVAGLNPTNTLESLSVTNYLDAGGLGYEISWTTATNRRYGVYWCNDLVSGIWLPLATNLEPAQNTYTDDVHGLQPVIYYRIGAHTP